MAVVDGEHERRDCCCERRRWRPDTRTLPEIEQILVPLNSHPTFITSPPFELKDVLFTVLRKYFFLLYACLNKHLRLINSSLVFLSISTFFWSPYQDWTSCAWLIMLNSNIISLVFTASSWNWGYQTVIKKNQRGGVYKVVETPGWECHQESMPFVMSQSVERLSEKRTT